MDQIKTKYFVDVGMGISFLAVFITGIIKFPGLLAFFGINRNNLPFITISKIHDWAGVLMGLFVLIHLILNRKWIVNVTKSFFAKKK